MSRRKLVCINGLILLICLILSTIIGVHTAASYVNDVELEGYLANSDLKVAYFDIGYDEETNRGYVDPSTVQEIEDLFAEDTIVVRACLDKEYVRESYYECVLTQIEVVEVLYGDCDNYDTMLVFEPVDCYSDTFIACTDGYSFMQEDVEYILFLKPLQNTFYGDDELVFSFSTKMYSKYPLNDEIPQLFEISELTEPDSMYLYSEIKEEEIYLYDEETYDTYLYLKEQVKEMYD